MQSGRNPTNSTAVISDALDEKRAAAATNEKPANKPKLLAASLDFDHSLAYNLEKLRTLTNAKEKIIQIIEDNRHLLKQLAAKAVLGNYDKVILLTGTNRQSWVDDFHCGFIHPNTHGSGSCFAVYPQLAIELEKEIANFKLSLQTDEMRTALGQEQAQRFINKKISVIYDPIVSADIVMKKNTSAQQALLLNQDLHQAQALFAQHKEASLTAISNSKLDTKNDHYFRCKNKHFIAVQSPTLFDQQKISLLYMQMHRLAKRHKNYQIDFLFLDDSVESILTPLANFYHDNSTLIPPSVNLQLFPYNKNNASYIELNKEYIFKRVTPPSTSIFDLHYKKNIILWWAITLNLLAGEERISLSELRTAIYQHITAGVTIGNDSHPYTNQKANHFNVLRSKQLYARQPLTAKSEVKSEMSRNSR